MENEKKIMSSPSRLLVPVPVLMTLYRALYLNNGHVVLLHSPKESRFAVLTLSNGGKF